MAHSEQSVRFVEYLRQLTEDRLRELFAGTETVHYTDFPDHPNVGDSAIGLGLLRFFRQQGIVVKRVDSRRTIDFARAVARSARPGGPTIAIHGGGNLGDLYSHHQLHREALLRRALPGTRIVQAPQSVHFSSPSSEQAFAELVRGSRAQTRFGVRDGASAAVISSAAECVLSPDSAHILGMIDAPKPRLPVVHLLRGDKESDPHATRAQPNTTVDWASDRPEVRLELALRTRGSRVPIVGDLAVPSARRWQHMAQLRVDDGVSLLAQGEVVITDRLHAMILGIHLGRRVVYIDNSIRKLSKYAQAWFPAWSSDVLRRAADLEEAEQLARYW